MISLIKNEIIKITHKTSFIVMIIILFLFVLTTNIIYKYALNDDKVVSEDYTEDIEKYKNEVDNATNLYDKIDAKTELDLLELGNKYGYDSWQYHYITSYEFRNLVLNKNRSLYNEEAYDSSLYDDYIKHFDEDDYKYFLEEEIETTKEEIESYKEIENNSDSEKEKSEASEYVKMYTNKLDALEYRIEKNISYDEGYLNTAVNIYENTGLIEDSNDQSVHNKYLESISNHELSKYIIETSRNINKVSDSRGILINFFNEYEMMIVLTIILLCGTIISDEYNKGTIKQLLITHYKRYEILLSKILVTMLTILISFIFILIMQLIIGGIFFGFESISIPAVVYNFSLNKVEEYNIFKYVLMMFLNKLPMFILISLIVLLINTITKNNAFTTIIGLVLYIVSPILNNMAVSDFTFINYFITPHWDLSIYLFGNIINNTYLNINTSIITCIIYIISILIMIFGIFNKSDIKNT